MNCLNFLCGADLPLEFREVWRIMGHSDLVCCPILDLTIGETPLTRLASADENASSSHPLPQRGEGSKINSPLAPLEVVSKLAFSGVNGRDGEERRQQGARRA
jgi:hypothetical protein